MSWDLLSWCQKSATINNEIIVNFFSYITYDPNYNYDDGDEDEDSMEDDGDLDDQEEDEDYSDDEDMSWKVNLFFLFLKYIYCHYEKFWNLRKPLWVIDKQR